MDINNEYLAYSQQIPAWGRSRKSTGQYDLIINALVSIGQDRAIVMTLDEWKKKFPSKSAQIHIRSKGRKVGLKIKFTEFEGKVCVSSVRLPSKNIHVEKEDGSIRVK